MPSGAFSVTVDVLVDGVWACASAAVTTSVSTDAEYLTEQYMCASCFSLHAMASTVRRSPG
jgi:hypothetical protein